MPARHRFAATAVLSLFSAAGFAQTSGKTVRIVVPFPPGGPSDYAARVVAQKLPEFLGQPVIVDNRPGANGTLGAELVARSAPDGTALCIANVGMITVLPHLQAKMPYDTFKDFTPVVNLIGGPSFLLVHPSIPARNVKELIALAKSRPGELTYASAGLGQISHMNGELMKLLAGINVLHVPYKGTGPIMPELIGGQVSMTFSTSIDTLTFVTARRVNLLAVTGKQRLSVLPDTPTMEQAGLPGFESLNWNGLVAPANLPRDTLTRLNRELVRAINAPDVKEKVVAQGNFVIGDTPEQFAAYIRSEYDKWGKVVKQANIKLE
ncbi:MAG: Bug family tripartite tricarboxylate transporter substrate binding protein [Burkholderiales bacterium]